MDWSRFDFRFQLDSSKLAALLTRIEGRKEAAMSLPLFSEWKTGLDTLNRIRAVHGSTALEGNTWSEDQVRRFIQGDAVLDPESRDLRQVQNADAAQRWVRERFGPGSDPPRRDELLRMHELITHQSDETNNVPGRLRAHGVHVGTRALGGVHIGAPHQELTTLMDEFTRFLNSGALRREHPVVRALLVHFFLVTIHPFGDGNGRVSRLVEAAILYRNGYNVHGFYGLSNYFYRNGEDYKRKLQESRRRQPFDVTPFVLFGLEGFEAELKGINNFIKTKMTRLMYRDLITKALDQRSGKRRRRLNPREHRLLKYLLDETRPRDPFSATGSERIALGALVRSPYVAGTYRNVTDRTFRRELERLDELGFITIDRHSMPSRPTVGIDFSVVERPYEEPGDGDTDG